jgi:uncharacterized protein YhaN
MKLRAVRLSEVGHFETGVALEGLSGGLDVLAGPNEMGKSTIFRAIEAVFREDHKHSGKGLQELAPADGGAPLIEVDFDVDGRPWRMRKRYLAQKSAMLTDLSGGTVLRGADAETKFADLKGGRLDRASLLPLMWVRQLDSVGLPADDAKFKLSKNLGRLIEDEIADAGGGGAARRVREAVALALERLVTRAHSRPTAGKPYKIAIDERDRVKAEFEKAQAAAAQAATRLSDLDAARARLKALRSPEAAAARADRLARLSERRAAVARAEEEYRLATQVVSQIEARLENLRNRHERLTRDLAEASRLRAILATGSGIQARASADVAASGDTLAKVKSAQRAARMRAADLQSQLELVDRHERARVIGRDADELVRRLNAARTGLARVAEIETTLTGNRLDEEAWRQLLALRMDAERLEARAAAALPRVRIDYLPDAAGRVRVAGQAVAESGEIAPDQTLHIDIEGVGRITVTAPAAAADAASHPRVLANTAREKMRALFERFNVADLEAAERLHAVRLKLVSEREAVLARLKTDAPDGLPRLEQKHADAVASLAAFASIGEAPPTPRPELEAQLSAVRASIATFDAEEAVAQAAVLDASKREAQILADQANAREQLGQLEKVLPAANDAAALLSSLAVERSAVEAELSAAIRDRGVWKAGIPEPAERAALDRDLATAETDVREVERTAQQLALDIKGLESALDRDRQDGVEAQLTEMQERLAAAEARVAAFATEVRELRLLETLLQDREQERRSTELAPVITRLQQLASGVLPGATFDLGDTLHVTGIARGGRTLSVQRLSGGTQEQLAVLVRLAYGRLLADRQSALPLVLDDALVYADDARFAAMIKLLGEASAHHQVIMLTCQAARIGALGLQPSSEFPMTLVGLTPWRPD